MSVTIISPYYINIDDTSIQDDLGYIPTNTKIKRPVDDDYKAGNVEITLDSLNIGRVENKSAADILDELTNQKIVSKLGYTPQDASTAFSGKYEDLEGTPDIPDSTQDVSNLKTRVSAIEADYTKHADLFSKKYADLTDVPSKFPTSWELIDNIPQIKWEDIEGAPEIPDDSSAAISGLQKKVSELETSVGNKAESSTVSDLSSKVSANESSIGTLNTTVQGHTTSIGAINETLGTKITLADVTWNNVSGKPNFFDGQYSSLTGTPELFSGSYDDLTNLPELFSGSWNDLEDKPELFSGSWNDLKDKPTNTETTYQYTIKSNLWSSDNTYTINLEDTADDTFITVDMADDPTPEIVREFARATIVKKSVSNDSLVLMALEVPTMDLPVEVTFKGAGHIGTDTPPPGN